MEQVFITGADRGVGSALCKTFLDHGFRVFGGQFMPQWHELDELKKTYGDALEIIPLNVADPESVRRAAKMTGEFTDHIDVLINCAGIVGEDDPEHIRGTYQVNAIGPLCMVENFLPLMQTGRKRLCFVSSEAGSVTLAHRDSLFGYCTSKTALNMSIRLMFNELQPKGYTFRIYHPGWVNSYIVGGVKGHDGVYEPEDTAAVAYRVFTGDRSWEDVLAMTDVENELWSF